MKWQVDEMKSWWNDKLMKWQVDRMILDEVILKVDYQKMLHLSTLQRSLDTKHTTWVKVTGINKRTNNQYLSADYNRKKCDSISPRVVQILSSVDSSTNNIFLS